jgi:chromosome segregation ATPase
LNYAVQETPFSIYVTIRKSEVKLRDPINNHEVNIKNEVGSNTVNSAISPDAFSRLKSDFEDTLEDLVAKNEYTKKLETLLKNSDEKVSNLEDLNGELQNVLDKNKALQCENDALNSIIKEVSENLITSERKVDDLISENRKLQKKVENITTKNTKLKNYSDALKKDIKLSKSEAEKVIVALEKNIDTVETELKMLRDKNFIEEACQTDEHPDIPYKVTDKLPPIFSSQLCHHSRRIYLSNSLPNLDSICWSKPSENFVDEAEEALAEQYDKQVKEFYLDERERVRAVHEQHHPPPGPGTVVIQE